LSQLASLARIIDAVNEWVGRTIAWAALAMVLVQFTVVVLRYVFGFGSILMQESVIYLHAILFMIGAGYTLLHEGHVRLDIFYRDTSVRTKALVDLWGSIGLLIPVTVLIWWSSWPYVAGSWKVLEGSKETSGIHAVFLLKTVILVFAALMLVQGISLMAKSILTLKGRRQDLVGN
jgi:TRAP-type mannitol/chloroaromatic compound transport system permease small subunit